MFAIGLMSGTSMDGIDASIIESDGTPKLINQIASISMPYSNQFKILLKSAEFAIRTQALIAIEKDIFDSWAILKAASANFLSYLELYISDELKTVNSEMLIQDLSSYLCPDKPNQLITLEQIIEHSTTLHAQIVLKLIANSGIDKSKISLIGYHGQTFFHRPEAKISIILGHGQTLANICGIKVINDFRSNDVNAGGKGAPLVPIYHLALAVRDNYLPCVVINCGGIANITLVDSDKEADLIGFDTGPGNGLIDRWVKKSTNGLKNMDEDGKYGSKGIVNLEVFQALYKNLITKDGQNFYDINPPKALDIGDLQLPEEINNLSIEDGCATLEAFTADTIVSSIHHSPKYWVLAGGGWSNPVIKRELNFRARAKFGQDITITTADEIGWSTQFLESQTFAYLAIRSFKHLPISFPSTTGVARPMLGGKLYFPDN